MATPRKANQEATPNASIRAKIVSLAIALALAMSGLAFAGCSQSQSSSASSASSAASSSASSAASSSSDNAVSQMPGNGQQPANANQGNISVEVTIDPSGAGDAADGHDFSAVEGPQLVFIQEGGTAYDALIATNVEVTGGPSFVEGINGLVPPAGSMAGWMYKVNGEIPMIAAGEFILSANDNVEWYYGTFE